MPSTTVHLGGPGGPRRLTSPESGSGSGDCSGDDRSLATGGRNTVMSRMPSRDPEPESGRARGPRGRRGSLDRAVSITAVGRATLAGLELVGALATDPRLERRRAS